MPAGMGRGFPLALWKPSWHAIGIGGERLPLGVLECRPLLPSVARTTIQSILLGSLSPPQQQCACEEKRETGKRAVHPHNNNARAKEKRGNGKENISFFPIQHLYMSEKNGERNRSTRFSGPYFCPSPEYQQAGRDKGRSMDGRACRSRYRR